MPVATCQITKPNYDLKVLDWLVPQQTQLSCLTFYGSINWLFFKPAESQSFIIINHYAGNLNTPQLQLLKDFVHLHTQPGYVYTVSSLLAWALSELGGTAMLMETLDRAVAVENVDRINRIDYNLSKLIYLLQYWNGSNLLTPLDETDDEPS